VIARLRNKSKELGVAEDAMIRFTRDNGDKGRLVEPSCTPQSKTSIPARLFLQFPGLDITPPGGMLIPGVVRGALKFQARRCEAAQFNRVLASASRRKNP